MKAINISTFKKDPERRFQDVSRHRGILVIRGETEDDAVVIMSLSEYNAIKETEHLLSTASNRKRLELSLKQLRQGQVVALNGESGDWHRL